MPDRARREREADGGRRRLTSDAATGAKHMIATCPVCGEPGTMIIYGLPGPELVSAAEAGRVSLGGCMIEPGQPDWYCPARHRWTDDDVDGRGRLLDEIVAECNAPAPPPTAH